jgi:tripeptidyl-peptidase-1
MSWIKFNATVEEAESLLKTEYGIYTNTETGNDHLACEDYSVPAHIQEHIDFITPTVHFDATVKQKKKRRDIQERGLSVKPVTQVKPNPDALVPQPQVTFSLANCYTYITPDCLRSLYNFTNGTLALCVYLDVELP